MLDRYESPLKLACLALAALLLFQVVHHLWHSDPLGKASIPPLPALTSPTNDVPVVAKKTNSTGTNIVVSKTNAMPPPPAMMMAGGKASRRSRSPMMPGFMGGGFPGGGGGMASIKLPSNIQSRVDRIKESEILGPFMRPPPMALMGIADDDVLLRAPDGQSGLVKVGGELGGVKLLRIGINRVLVEQDGEKKELTLFNGMGSESLLDSNADTDKKELKKTHHKENP